MDFYQICTREPKGKEDPPELYPDFVVGRSDDLMVRGKSFYAIWDQDNGLWSTDEYDVQRIVDISLKKRKAEIERETGMTYNVKYLRSFNNGMWSQFKKFTQNISDNSVQLDQKLTFANDNVKKNDYVSRRLDYALEPGDYSAWDELVGTLYSVEERAKIEWAIGAIVSGDSKKIQKFLVLYGPAGTGKSTILNIMEKLFTGYTTTFEAKALGSNNGAFATEVFKHNPLVAIQHDGDLSKIEDNTRLNSIISHEEMTMNEKYKASYTAKVVAFLLMGTNQPVKISDAKSGIIRRLIDVHPTGVKIPANHYNTLMSKIDFELGAIAHRCLEVYREMGKNYYNSYRPTEMMLQTDVFYNFIEAHWDIFKEQNSTSLKQAYTLYKEFCSETGIDRVLPQHKFREELRNYFDEFHDRKLVDGNTVRSFYEGFNANQFKVQTKEANTFSLVMEETVSILDEEYADQPAQLWVLDEETGLVRPRNKWSKVKTKLRDINTKELHYVKIPENHIVIDFDLEDINGHKSLERNLEAASVWPATYAELSKSGSGVHLHYTYEGDVSELTSHYSDGIEVKTLLGEASLRRQLTKCNNIPISKFPGTLPKKEKKLLAETQIKSEKGLRDLVIRNLNKEIHPGTKPSVDFIKKILDDAYDSGMTYDLSDMKKTVMAFANSSSNQSEIALKTAMKIKWRSEDQPVPESKGSVAGLVDSYGDDPVPEDRNEDESPIVFYDIEVYPNLFVVCWKAQGSKEIVRMINPSAQDVEKLFKLKLVGFNNRRYDNHILYAAYMGYNNLSLYNLSQAIINNKPGVLFGNAYNLSYADIYDFSSIKQSLKKWEIELGMHHMEMDLSWDEPVPEELWAKVVEYCCNDVLATEGTFENRKQDFVARQILAELSGLTVNDTTQKHTARIIFGNDKNPQAKFVYTKLEKEFPGYEFDAGKSSYRGEDPSEGGYVYEECGSYENVVVLDVASMHPTSIIQLNAFGEYTPNFKALLDARIAIKRENFEEAKTLLDGKLAPYLGTPDEAEALSYALKIVINIVYGLTSAKFDNPFRDIRNKDNIVAKRGALFMIDLKHYVQEELGLQVVHIKTDSIKIPNATSEHIDAVMRFGEKYGYEFEHEATYDKFCLIDKAQYISRYGWAAKKKLIGKWDATGAKFQHPYVFKTLFSGEMVEQKDLAETKQVTQGIMYLDFEYDRPAALVEGMQHVGRTGRFVPVTQESGGGVLYRVKDGKNYAVAGTKGYLWVEEEMFKEGMEVDMGYFHHLVDDATKAIEKFVPFEEFMDIPPNALDAADNAAEKEYPQFDNANFFNPNVA